METGGKGWSVILEIVAPKFAKTEKMEEHGIWETSPHNV